LSDAIDIERSLASLGARIEYPPAVDLTARVRARIGEPRPGFRRWLSMQVVRPAFAATALVVAACVALIVSSGAREAVADLLGLGGVRIETQGELPAAGAELDLGRRMSLAEARSLVNFDVLVPQRLGSPDEVYYLESVSTGQVALVYGAAEALPPAVQGSRAGVVITEFRAQLQEAVYKKMLEFSTVLQGVIVNGEPGFWIEGDPHVIEYVDPQGKPGRLSSRLVGNTLLWSQDALTLRIESSLSLKRSLEIASSLR
jgi:hypothetical protein